MNFWEATLLLFSFVAFIMALFFSFRGRSRLVSNFIFSILLLLFSYHVFFNVLFWSRFNQVLLVHLSLTDVIPLSLYGPLFYFYLREVVKNQGFKIKDLIHFAPFFIIFGVRIGFFSLNYESKLHAILSRTVTEHVYFIPGSTVILSTLMICYGIYSFIKYASEYKYDPELKIWMRCISFVFILFSISCLAYYTFTSFRMMQINHEYFVNLLMVFFILLVSFFVFIYPNILNGKPIEKIIPFIKYERTGLSKDFSLELKNKLLAVMNDEKPYLDSEISLNKIADLLDISRHHASQIINEHFQVHFFDFINNYRINEAKQLMLSDTNTKLSIIDIAFETGFNNRISFYKAFKKVTGKSPSEYKKLGATA